MQISIQVDDNGATGSSDAVGRRAVCMCLRLRHTVCRLSLFNMLTVCVSLAIIVAALYLCKTYMPSVLFWLEDQDLTVVSFTIIILFTLVSLPIAVGYIILVIADGYLFGMFNGLILSIIGANTGLWIAHNLLKLVSHHHTIRRIGENEMTNAIVRVISGPLCFKIVLCARLTPIPFGLQNTIFALSKVNAKVYHIASFFGLLPAQTLAVYVGTTVRSMQDVFESRGISTGTYILAGLQLLVGAILIWMVGTKAHKELLKALAEGEGKILAKSGNMAIA